jgi:hypothetical protein
VTAIVVVLVEIAGLSCPLARAIAPAAALRAFAFAFYADLQAGIAEEDARAVQRQSAGTVRAAVNPGNKS